MRVTEGAILVPWITLTTRRNTITAQETGADGEQSAAFRVPRF